ncbi:MAG: hypothetical protein KY466_00710 [Gemmatimonadetes bacterium]|nr:hypothetical protein [Gemmatimonadota bacterium]
MSPIASAETLQIHARTLLGLLLLAAAAPAGAQGAEPCDFERCGLRVQGTSVLRGPGTDRVAGLGRLYADLRFLETAGDSAAILARTAARAHERSQLAGALATVALLPLYEHFYVSGRVREDPSWTSAGLGLTGVVALYVAAWWQRPVRGSVSRAVWWYNRGVAAGEVYDRSPELPALDPDHFGRAGLVWGAFLGMAAGQGLARHTAPDREPLLELLALPAATAGVGWLVGRAIDR